MSAQNLQTDLEQLLKVLNLSKIREILPGELDRILRERTSAAQWLKSLLTKEVAARLERRIERRIKESKLPERKLLQDYDFDFQTGVDKSQIMGLVTLDFVARKRSVIFGGHSGTGKSYLAKALLLEACQYDYRCLYTSASDMLRHLRSGLVDDTLEKKIKRYLNPEVLLIDELGFDQIEQEETRYAALFFKVVEGRNGKASTIYTTNLDFKQLGDYLGDPVVTSAIVDRMIHHAIIIHIKGPSWRLHQSQQINQGA